MKLRPPAAAAMPTAVKGVLICVLLWSVSLHSGFAEQRDSAQSAQSLPAITQQQAEKLAAQARAAMEQKNYPRAISVYTTLVQRSGHSLGAQAQEYLALARERNGQIAHARAGYEKYLASYPNAPGAARVRQRLNALLAVQPGAGQHQLQSGDKSGVSAAHWDTRSFVSQYYRRDTNQFDGQNERVSQSAVLSNLDVISRRKGQRFDLKSRLSAGYTMDLLSAGQGPGNSSRISMLYADLHDKHSLIRARIGRQSLHKSGVMGRFDGLHLSRLIRDWMEINLLAGFPVGSSKDRFDSERSFYGLSVDFGTFADRWDFSLFYNHQDIADIENRDAAGGELRYSDKHRSLLASVDYEMGYGRLSSAYLHGNWRIGDSVSAYALVSRVYSPFLTTQNALIGQSAQNMDELLLSYSEQEIRQLAVDRSAAGNNLNLGLSKKISARSTIRLNLSNTSRDATVESANVAMLDSSSSSSLSLALSSRELWRDEDFAATSLRFYDYSSAKGATVSFDYRVPLGKGFRFNPRIRFDQRQYSSDDSSDDSDQSLVAIALRVDRRWGKRLKFEFAVGNELVDRDRPLTSEERRSLFIDAGYRYTF